MAVSRRTFLGGSAAAIGVAGTAALSGTLAPSPIAAIEPSSTDLAALAAPLVLSVVDADRGEFEILVGETAVPFTDTSLVAKLAQAARSHRHVVTS